MMVVCVWNQLIKTDRGSHWRQANVETAPFYTNKEVDQLIKEIEVSKLLILQGSCCVLHFCYSVSRDMS